MAVAYPWLAITFWFQAWAPGSRLGLVMTILYAHVIPLLGICLAMRLEEILDAAKLRPVRDCQAWKQS